MKSIFSLAFMLFVISVFSQETKTWKVSDYGVTYRLPESWRSDPFSSSSVCDCSGTINDNGEWDSLYLGMVVYTSNVPIKDSTNRSKIWSYQFSSDDKGEEVLINGIKFIKKKGFLNDSDEINFAWQYVSIDAPKKDKMHLMVYFWGNQNQFSKNETTFLEIMKTMKRK
jgi:hypothetical protein